MARPEVALAMRPDLPARLFSVASRERLRAVASVDPGDVRTDLRALGDTEVLLSGWGCPPVDAAVLDGAPRLRAIVHAAGGVKGHVTPACWERGILVSTAADANAVPVAEYTLAMILLAGKSVHRMARAYAARRAAIDLVEAFPVAGTYRRTVGIIGASRVGRRVIELLRPFDLEVLVSDPYLGEASTELDELLARSDIVSIHAPALPSTRHLLDARRLALLRDGAVLINTARGSLVDHGALVAELAGGRIDAILDVTDPHEPLPADSPLWELPNVVITPHVAGALGVELQRLGDAAVAELERYAAGEPFAHPVTAADLDRVA